jgi:hypothetical protein
MRAQRDIPPGGKGERTAIGRAAPVLWLLLSPVDLFLVRDAPAKLRSF